MSYEFVRCVAAWGWLGIMMVVVVVVRGVGRCPGSSQVRFLVVSITCVISYGAMPINIGGSIISYYSVVHNCLLLWDVGGGVIFLSMISLKNREKEGSCFDFQRAVLLEQTDSSSLQKRESRLPVEGCAAKAQSLFVVHHVVRWCGALFCVQAPGGSIIFLASVHSLVFAGCFRVTLYVVLLFPWYESKRAARSLLLYYTCRETGCRYNGDFYTRMCWILSIVQVRNHDVKLF